MSPNTTDTGGAQAPTGALPSGRARQRRLISALTALAFIAIGAVALYAVSLISGAVILLVLSALLAYFIYPLTRLLQRRLKRPLAIVVAYLLVTGALLTLTAFAAPVGRIPTLIGSLLLAAAFVALSRALWSRR